LAIFSLNHSFVTRGKGHNIFQRAAYNSRDILEDRAGEKFDFKSRDGLLHEEVSVPLAARSWLKNRQHLWQTLDAREDQSTRPESARLAHSFIIALPSEFSVEQNVRLLRDFVHEQFTRKGFAVDWSIHQPPDGGDVRNVHAHLLVSLRQIDTATGRWSDKKWRPPQNLSESVKGWRRSWANLTNRHLKRYGFEARIDHRTNAVQGVQSRPGRHNGPKRTWALRADQEAAAKSSHKKGSGSRSSGSTGSMAPSNLKTRLSIPKAPFQALPPLKSTYHGPERRRKAVFWAIERREDWKPR